MENMLPLAKALEIEDGYLDIRLDVVEPGLDIIIDEGGDTYLHCVKIFDPNDRSPPRYDKAHDRMLVSSHLLRLTSPVFARILRENGDEENIQSDGKKHSYIPFTVSAIEPLMAKLHYQDPSLKLTGRKITVGIMEEMLIFIAEYGMHTVSLRISQCVYHGLYHTWKHSPIAKLWPDMRQGDAKQWLPELQDEKLVKEAMQWVTVAAGMWQSSIMNIVGKIVVLTANVHNGRIEFNGRAIANHVTEKVTESIVAKRERIFTAVQNVLKLWIQRLLHSQATYNYFYSESRSLTQLNNLIKINNRHRDNPSMSVVELHGAVVEIGNLPLVEQMDVQHCKKVAQPGDPGVICAKIAKEMEAVIGAFAKENWDVAPHFAKRNPNRHYNPSFL